MRMTAFVALIVLFTSHIVESSRPTDQSQPNIVFVLADDLGYNDIGYHNLEIIMPNINALAESGIT